MCGEIKLNKPHLVIFFLFCCSFSRASIRGFVVVDAFGHLEMDLGYV